MNNWFSTFEKKYNFFWVFEKINKRIANGGLISKTSKS
jgi:hypothetical protein